jgi:hypothetical protein
MLTPFDAIRCHILGNWTLNTAEQVEQAWQECLVKDDEVLDEAIETFYASLAYKTNEDTVVRKLSNGVWVQWKRHATWAPSHIVVEALCVADFVKHRRELQLVDVFESIPERICTFFDKMVNQPVCQTQIIKDADTTHIYSEFIGHKPSYEALYVRIFGQYLVRVDVHVPTFKTMLKSATQAHLFNGLPSHRYYDIQRFLHAVSTGSVDITNMAYNDLIAIVIEAAIDGGK